MEQANSKQIARCMCCQVAPEAKGAAPSPTVVGGSNMAIMPRTTRWRKRLRRSLHKKSRTNFWAAMFATENMIFLEWIIASDSLRIDVIANSRDAQGQRVLCLYIAVELAVFFCYNEATEEMVRVPRRLFPYNRPHITLCYHMKATYLQRWQVEHQGRAILSALQGRRCAIQADRKGGLLVLTPGCELYGLCRCIQNYFPVPSEALHQNLHITLGQWTWHNEQGESEESFLNTLD